MNKSLGLTHEWLKWKQNMVLWKIFGLPPLQRLVCMCALLCVNFDLCRKIKLGLGLKTYSKYRVVCVRSRFSQRFSKRKNNRHGSRSSRGVRWKVMSQNAPSYAWWLRLMLTARRFQMKINRREEEIMMELRVCRLTIAWLSHQVTQLASAIIVNCISSVCSWASSTEW